ncbi:MAG: hemolysin III family protein [Actinomycetes bacterium]|jgi:hemolysin III
MSQLLDKPPAAEKPRLRGLIHLIMSPVSLVAGLVLVALADKLRGRIALGIFTLAAVTLFTGSALYHRVGWKPKTKEVWRRIDHANITVLIAGTYTPFAIFLLNKGQAIVLLSIVWGGAILTSLMRVLWLNAPRWLYVPLYLILGWAAVIFLPEFWQHGGVAVFILITLGGLCYSLGGIVYGLKKPNFSRTWFGFHEFFHALTAAAFILQFIAAGIVVYTHH